MPPKHSVIMHVPTSISTVPKALHRERFPKGSSRCSPGPPRDLQTHLVGSQTRGRMLPPLKGACQIQGTPRHGHRELRNSNLFSSKVSSSQAQERIAESWRPAAPLQPGYLQPPVLFLSAPPSTPSWATGQLCTTRHLSRSAQGPTTSPELRTPRARHHTPALEALMPSNTIATCQETWRKGAQKHTTSF